MDPVSNPPAGWSDKFSLQVDDQASEDLDEPIDLTPPDADYWQERALEAEFSSHKAKLENLELKRKLAILELDVEIKKQLEVACMARVDLASFKARKRK